MSARLRWKREPRPTGLLAVGAGPQGSAYHDGEKEYARTYPNGGNWQRAQEGWYWTARIGDDFINTCRAPVATEDDAKAHAAAWVKERL
jgi:hypothetical protein